MAEKDYRSIAAQIIEIVGKDNIISATHCATRLRLIVKDKDAIDTKKLEKVDLVKGTFFNAGQYQIILGTGIVNKVYAELEGLGLHTISKQEQDEAVKQQQKGIKRMMRTLGDIFIPIIPVIAATGLFLGLKGCLFNDNVLGDAGVPLPAQRLLGGRPQERGGSDHGLWRDPHRGLPGQRPDRHPDRFDRRDVGKEAAQGHAQRP